MTSTQVSPCPTGAFLDAYVVLLLPGEPLPDGSFEMLKLCDFGVARKLASQNTHLTADIGWGTVKYMAPEMVHSLNTDGRLRFGLGIDIWALGIILHQLLHDGKTPYHHLVKKGRLRLFVGIADKRSARVLQVIQEYAGVSTQNIRVSSATLLSKGRTHQKSYSYVHEVDHILGRGTRFFYMCWPPVVHWLNVPSAYATYSPRRYCSSSTNYTDEDEETTFFQVSRPLADSGSSTQVQKDFLISLQNSCLQHDAKERPNVEELLRVIRLAMDDLFSR